MSPDSEANALTTRRPATAGFTLIEVVVVLSVVLILVGAATPMTRLFVDQGRREAVRADLRVLSEALQDFYHDNGAMPASLTATGFYAVYFSPGVDDTVVLDSWGGNVEYVYALTTDPDVATVRSRGPNGVDDGGTGDDIELVVPGSAPGGKRTRARMRVIVEALADFLEAGGTLTGTWSTDRAAMGLGAEYADDGFGTPFTLYAATLVLRSAGPDRTAGNADDLTS